jgi:hypoxanthine-DNA glycosylase
VLINSLDPVVDDQSQVMVLGTMPGEESLRLQQYYANPRNQFWRIIYGVFDSDPEAGYKQRLSYLLKKGIALWDVLSECERVGSSDSAIRNAKPNDFKEFLLQHQRIKCIALNGSTAADLFANLITYKLPADIDVIQLPSTSGTPGRYVKPYPEKVRTWSTLLSYLTYD